MTPPTEIVLNPNSDLQNLPGLERRHVDGARLYADRRDMVASLGIAESGTIAEVGVALGDFSEFLLDHLRPKQFVAFDLFRMHEDPVIWGQPAEVLFKGMTQLAFYKARFANRGDQITVEVGLSYDALARYPDQYFDLIYIDAGHDYESVKKDAEMSALKIKPGGTLIFNDYVMNDCITWGPYGVVKAVNEMIVRDNWRVVGFALQRHMFCDLAVRKP